MKIATPILRGLAVLALGLTLGGASRAAEWQNVPCASSPFRLAGASSCQMIERVTGHGVVGRVDGVDYALRGASGAFSYAATFFGPPPRLPNTMPGWKPYDLQHSERIIRANARAAAHDFRSYQGFDHTGYLEFRRGARHCVGFDHGGGPKLGGYLYFVRGEICSNAPLGAPAKLVKELLAAMEIDLPGASTTSALGASSVPLPWSTQAVQR